MATTGILKTQEDLLLYASIFDPLGEASKSRGSLIEKKIEFLENFSLRISNRRARRLINDRILMDLVPRLNAEEVRGLFAPPPWGDEAPVSAFSMTNVGEWDIFRNIDMDKEASIMKGMKNTSSKRKSNVDADKRALLDAWHRVDLKTREALRRSFLSDLLEVYEKCIRAFIQKGEGEGEGEEVLVFRVQDPFHRLLLHGVCDFYNLTSVTETREGVKMTKIKKNKSGSAELTNITLTHFLKMSKEGIW